MTPDNARMLAHAILNLGASDDGAALIAARLIAKLIAAEGIPPNTLAAALFVTLTNLPRPAAMRSFAELGPRGMHKRLAELSRRRGISDADKARIMGMRERMADARDVVLTPEEIAWLDALWNTPEPARAKNPG